MHLETSVEIGATPAEVWSVLVDIDRWPAWTETVSELERLDTGPLGLSSRVRLKQP